MEDAGIHPDPPADLHERQPLVKAIGRAWMRIHRLDKAPLHFGRSRRHRFDDPEGEYGVLYMAEDAHGAFIETFGRQLDVRSVTSQQLSARALTSIESRRALRLVDLTSSGGLARLSADGRLTCASVGPAPRWSRALWLHPIGADGIYYRLRHDPDRCGCALFDRASDAMTVSSQGTLNDPAYRAMLGSILDAYGFSLLAD